MKHYVLLWVDYDWYTITNLELMSDSLEEVQAYIDKAQEGARFKYPTHQMTWEEFDSQQPYELNDDEHPHYLIIEKETPCPKCHLTRN